jgi:hypothetical protein
VRPHESEEDLHLRLPPAARQAVGEELRQPVALGAPVAREHALALPRGRDLLVGHRALKGVDLVVGAGARAAHRRGGEEGAQVVLGGTCREAVGLGHRDGLAVADKQGAARGIQGGLGLKAARVDDVFESGPRLGARGAHEADGLVGHEGLLVTVGQARHADGRGHAVDRVDVRLLEEDKRLVQRMTVEDLERLDRVLGQHEVLFVVERGRRGRAVLPGHPGREHGVQGFQRRCHLLLGTHTQRKGDAQSLTGVADVLFFGRGLDKPKIYYS